MPISEPSPRISVLVRAALFVSDLDNSIRFYRDVIGLQACYARGQREMTFRDPDGVMVNVIERAPDAD